MRGEDGLVRAGVLAVEGDDALPGLEPHRGEHVTGAGVVGQLELDAIGSGALAQAGEQADRDFHPPDPRAKGQEIREAISKPSGHAPAPAGRAHRAPVATI